MIGEPSPLVTHHFICAEDLFNAATNPDGILLLLTGLPTGLTEGDFGPASWGDFDGANGDELVNIVPEPTAVLLLLLLSGVVCGLLLRRRRR